MKKKIFIILLILFFIHIVYRVFQYRNEYTSHFDPSYWEYRYLHSQWVMANPIESIGDDGLYAYAGWKYITGIDPSLLNPEIPPFGKYLIGLSILIFGNQNIFSLLVGLSVLLVFYKINTVIFRDRLLAFLPVFIFSFDPLYYEQLRAPYLDLLQLVFLLFTFLFIFKKRYIVSSLFLGCFAAVKFSPLSIILLLTIGIYLFFQKNEAEMSKYVQALIVFPMVFLASYFRYFLLGHSLREFLGLQKYVINFYAVGAKADPGIVFPMLFTGNWHTWFAGAQKVTEWSFIWPISLLLSIIGIFYLIKERKAESLTLIAIWIVAYLLFLSFIPTSPRYLLLLLPFMYNLAIWILSKSIHSRLLQE